MRRQLGQKTSSSRLCSLLYTSRASSMLHAWQTYSSRRRSGLVTALIASPSWCSASRSNASSARGGTAAAAASRSGRRASTSERSFATVSSTSARIVWSLAFSPSSCWCSPVASACDFSTASITFIVSSSTLARSTLLVLISTRKAWYSLLFLAFCCWVRSFSMWASREAMSSSSWRALDWSSRRAVWASFDRSPKSLTRRSWMRTFRSAASSRPWAARRFWSARKSLSKAALFGPIRNFLANHRASSGGVGPEVPRESRAPSPRHSSPWRHGTATAPPQARRERCIMPIAVRMGRAGAGRTGWGCNARLWRGAEGAPRSPLTPSYPLSRYAGGGLGWGRSARQAFVFRGSLRSRPPP